MIVFRVASGTGWQKKKPLNQGNKPEIGLDVCPILPITDNLLSYKILMSRIRAVDDPIIGPKQGETMQSTSTMPTVPAVQLPVMLVAEVQDSLLVVVHDLNRLDSLLAHTMENLMERFTRASENLADPVLVDCKELDGVRSALRAAVTELQFQDMASQLINHTSKILQGCAYRLASESMGQEDGEALPFVEDVPERPNPVTQDEMEAGSVELF